MKILLIIPNILLFIFLGSIAAKTAHRLSIRVKEMDIPEALQVLLWGFIVACGAFIFMLATAKYMDFLKIDRKDFIILIIPFCISSLTRLFLIGHHKK